MVSKYKSASLLKEKQKALSLYKKGLSLRVVGERIGRSHQWVFRAINDLEPVDRELITPK